ncbi:MAG: RdgB/HAM1 family non-canonical purine NTP pyrophosphatase [Gammaproteobacteria bacterium]|nr:MAG: RdgB/HAM1 family non-canonical purine NTP pyrophosphatase [Gammaproteobacteria bacterium]
MFSELVLASNNNGKAKELLRLLEPLNINVISQSEFGVPDVIEDGLTFVENAIKKARNAAYHTGKAAVADDSGIEVDALNGAPGIYSARFAGDDATDAENNIKLLNDLKEVPQEKRTARFQCVMVLMRHYEDPTPIICQGTWEGQILFEERGENGFGYDPLFLVPSRQLSSAELAPELKNLISHRAQACHKLIEALDPGRIQEGDEVMQDLF